MSFTLNYLEYKFLENKINKSSIGNDFQLITFKQKILKRK